MSTAAACAAGAAMLAVVALADLLGALRRVRPGRSAGGGSPAGAVAAIGRRLGLVREPEDLAARIAAAGLPPRVSPADVMAVKGGAAVLMLAAALAPALMAGPGAGLLVAAGAAGAGFVAPDVWLARHARARARAAAAELPGALDLLAVALAAGLPPARALGEVGARTSGVLAAEARQAAALIALGERRAAAMGAVAARIALPEVAALIAALERSERHGTPAATAVRALAAQARARRACALREHAARAAPKIQLVVALGLVPGVMLLVGAAVAASLG